jgi:acyl dehydratase
VTEVETAVDLAAFIGKPLGSSDWVEITQDMIDAFAALTGDRQWIHIDVERARQEAPDGKTIAHGFMILALIPDLQRQIYTIRQRGKGLNYGCNRIRFTAPVPAGSQVRLHQSVKACEHLNSGVRITLDCTVEIQHQTRPALVAETLLQIFNV